MADVSWSILNLRQAFLGIINATHAKGIPDAFTLLNRLSCNLDGKPGSGVSGMQIRAVLQSGQLEVFHRGEDNGVARKMSLIWLAGARIDFRAAKQVSSIKIIIIDKEPHAAGASK